MRGQNWPNIGRNNSSIDFYSHTCSLGNLVLIIAKIHSFFCWFIVNTSQEVIWTEKWTDSFVIISKWCCMLLGIYLLWCHKYTKQWQNKNKKKYYGGSCRVDATFHKVTHKLNQPFLFTFWCIRRNSCTCMQTCICITMVNKCSFLNIG